MLLFLTTDRPFTMIDTPGFGIKDLRQEIDQVDDLVDLLKDQIKFVHVFLIAFSGRKPRFNAEITTMIEMFEKMFGEQFWRNAMIVATKYSFSTFLTEERRDNSETEESWAKIRVDKLHDLFGAPVSSIKPQKHNLKKK